MSFKYQTEISSEGDQNVNYEMLSQHPSWVHASDSQITTVSSALPPTTPRTNPAPLRIALDQWGALGS